MQFQQRHQSTHCLKAVLEKWNLGKDKSNSFGALLTDLLKVFGCLSSELIIAKLEAYGFRRSALKLMYTYLFDTKRRNKISIFYSLW